MNFSLQLIKARTFWLKIHLYLALSIGFFIALMGLTGSIGVYWQELDELLNPSLVIDEPQGRLQSLDQIMKSVHRAHPDRYGSWTLEMPRSPQGMLTAWYDKPQETFFEFHAPLMVSVNPYTAEVVASRFWGQTVATWWLDLHTQLQLGRFGWNAVGILGLLLPISVISGLYLWWPGVNQLINTFKIHHNRGTIRLLFDLHRTLGLFSAGVLLLLAGTGFLLSYPKVLEQLTGSSGMQHGETGRTLASTAIPNNHPTGLAAAAFVAQGAFPKAELRRVTTPAGTSGIYRINFRQALEINQRHPYTTVWVDRWSGQIKAVRNPATFSRLETLASWIWPLHSAEALGSTGRLVWFLAGQSLFFLYLSGLVRWLHKLGKIKDRPVDLAALRAYAWQQTKSCYHLSHSLLHRLLLLAQQTKRRAPPVALIKNRLALWLQQLSQR
jgi:uncharacterized iron-regulated membrane protein